MFNEQEKWRKFLSPLVQAIIGALAIYSAAAHQSYSRDNDVSVELIDHRLTEVEQLKRDVKDLSVEVHELIGELRVLLTDKNIYLKK